jgi:hypothetical protein
VIRTLKSMALNALRVRYITDRQFRLVLIGTLIFNLAYSFDYFRDQGLWEASRVPLDPNAIIFRDDRDGWLRAAQYLASEGSIGNERWQLNFWPPGQVFLTTILVFLFRNYQLILLSHVLLSAVLLALIYWKIFRLMDKSLAKRNLVFCLIIFWNFSFMNLSSITSLVLCPDYIAALLFFLGLILILDKNLERKHLIQLFIPVVLLSASAYLRITYYQAIWIILGYALVQFASRKIQHTHNTASISRFLIVLIVTVTTFLPWIGVRYYANGETLVKAFQFSEQSRFAMTVAWWDEKTIKKFNAEHIGAGIACKIDSSKCEYFSNRDKDILAGNSNVNWGQDADEKTKAALQAYFSDPEYVFRAKIPILWNAYFQRMAFSSIEGAPYYTWDKVIFLLALLAGLIYLIKNRRRAPILLFISLLGVGWILTLLLTQVEFRYLLPSFVLMLAPIAHLHKYKSP